MKIQGLSLVYSLLGKVGISYLNIKCKVKRTKVVSQDVSVGDNSAKTRAIRKFSPTCLRIKLWRKCF